MCLVNARPIAGHPPLALRLRSGLVLTDPRAQWHFELLVQAGIPGPSWAEVVAESGFVDPQGIFIVGHGARVLEGKAYFARSTVGGQPDVELRGPHEAASRVTGHRSRLGAALSGAIRGAVFSHFFP